MRKKILILTDFYLPGVKGGGPIQSIKNIVDNLYDKMDFYILTSDRDFGDKNAYKDIETDLWLKLDNAKVYYTDKSKLTSSKMSKIFNELDYDLIYLNSFFSYKFSIMPILLKKFNRISGKIVLAPRGEFSPGALGLKSNKKKLYIQLSRVLKLHENIKWHATAETEKKDIIKIFKKNANIAVIKNFTANYEEEKFVKLKKERGQLKIIFVSRIHPKKNLLSAIEYIKEVEGDIIFNIFGPIEDESYWSLCKKKIDKLAPNKQINYKGVIEHKNILNVFQEHHVFLLPTLGENFGHVIFEALIGGCPPIISDQTPWRNLDKKNVGWDISLSNKDAFVSTIQKCVDLRNEEYQLISNGAFKYGKEVSFKKDQIQDMNYKLFNLG